MNPNPQAAPEPGFKDLNLPVVGLCLIAFFLLIFVATIAGRMMGLRNRRRDMRETAALAQAKCEEFIARLTAAASLPSPLIAQLRETGSMERLPEFLALLRQSGETDLSVAAQQLEECARVKSDADHNATKAEDEYELIRNGWPGSMLAKIIKL